MNFDTEGARLLLASITERGVKIPFDVEHFSLSPAQTGADISPDSKSKAWGVPVVRNGELWVDEITYISEEVRLAIEAKELLYTSPVLSLDAQKRPTCILSVAFTNTPAIYSTDPLTFSANQLQEGTFPQMDEQLQQIMAMLQQILAALATKAEMSSDKPKSDDSEDSALFSAVTRITGKTSRQEQIGAVLALGAQVQFSARNAKASKVDALVQKGLLTPADRSTFMGLSDTALEAFSVTASSFQAPTTLAQPPAPSATGAINDAEIASFAAAAGVSVESFKASMKGTL